jgi:hypothetical protein
VKDYLTGWPLFDRFFDTFSCIFCQFRRSGMFNPGSRSKNLFTSDPGSWDPEISVADPGCCAFLHSGSVIQGQEKIHTRSGSCIQGVKNTASRIWIRNTNFCNGFLPQHIKIMLNTGTVPGKDGFHYYFSQKYPQLTHQHSE